METLTLDGRKFRSNMQGAPASQTDYVIEHLRAAGAVEVVNDLDGVKRTPEKRAEDLLTRILLSGKNHILAGCLTEEGKVWNRKDADANAERFAAITDVLEKAEMQKSMETFVTALLAVRGGVGSFLIQ
jgi:hypothetical protein